jgi:hypothetical protein
LFNGLLQAVGFCLTTADSLSCFLQDEAFSRLREFSHMADDNKDTVFWVRWLCLSQMGNGTVSGTAESSQWVCQFVIS